MLTAKKRLFIDEYLVDLNATKAAERAGYSPRTARAQGQRLLTDVDIATAIQAEKDARAERCKVRQDEVLRELIALVRTNAKHFDVSPSGELVLSEMGTDESWRAVGSIKYTTRIIPQGDDEPITEKKVEYKLWDKNPAIDKAMRHLGILSTEVTVNLSAVEQFLLRRHTSRTNGNGQRASA